MKTLCFSSFSFSYLNRARVLFSSLRRFHPEWTIAALITDRPPAGWEFHPEREPFDELVWADDLAIPKFESWLFQHTVVEACTAVKGPFLRAACRRDFDAVIYLDPDTAVFSRLDSILTLLEVSDIVLTPHLLEAEHDISAVIDNELSALRTGIYNLGFVAIRTSGDGRRFADWWAERLLTLCFDELERGLFTDQRWCDFVPALFEKVAICRDPGCNVASWNLNGRRVSITKGGDILINGETLKFWHFTKYGSQGESATRRYASDNFEIFEVWNWYRRQMAENTDAAIPERYWGFGTFEDGKPILDAQRRMYRDHPRLQELFPLPFTTHKVALQAWLESEASAASSESDANRE